MGEIKLSREMLDMLTEFLIMDISDKVVDGITYSLCMKTDKELIEKGRAIKNEALKLGFKNDEVFRVYEINNGYIFDMDLKIAKFLTVELAKVVSRESKGAIPQGDPIGDFPEKRRAEDMLALAKYCKSQYEKGNLNIEVALFSRNSVPRIVIQGKDKQGKNVTASYNAYAIRHWDIEDVNNKILIPRYGIRIARIKPCEILSSKTGVRFEMSLARAV